MHTTNRQRRRLRSRTKVHGTAVRPRASVSRSARYTAVQLIDDEAGKTVLHVFGKKVTGATKVEQALAVGREVAKEASLLGIKAVVFDRSGYAYHGRIKAVADGLREGGLQV